MHKDSYRRNSPWLDNKNKEGKFNMKQFIGTKIIKAKPMSRFEYNSFRGWPIPNDENPADEGYLVEYSDGYISWSPKKQFDEAYRECDNMTFGLAIEALKKGLKVARKGWNGKNQFLFLVKGESLEYYTAANLENLQGEGIHHPDVIAIKTTVGDIQVGWLASQTDMLAEDWVIVD